MPTQSLIHVLEEILSINQELESLAKEKREVLIAGNIARLAEIVQQETLMIKRLGKLEEQRHATVERFIAQRNLDNANGFTFSDLLIHIDHPFERRRLENLQQELVALLHQLHQLNDINQQLIQHSLDFVNYTIELLAEEPVEQIYQSPKQADRLPYQPQKRSFFDTKA